MDVTFEYAEELCFHSGSLGSVLKLTFTLKPKNKREYDQEMPLLQITNLVVHVCTHIRCYLINWS